jgi:hypothetical protein
MKIGLSIIFYAQYSMIRNRKGFIIDGLHRAKALTNDYNESHPYIPQLTIVECFGGAST